MQPAQASGLRIVVFMCSMHTHNSLLATKAAHCFERSFALRKPAGYQQQPEARQCVDEAVASCKLIFIVEDMLHIPTSHH